MKARLIYVEGRETNFGYGNEYKDRIVEVNGQYYKVNSWYSFNGSGGRISRIDDFDSKEIPAEYSKMEYKQYCWLSHEHGREIDIDLTEYDIRYLPEELQELAKREVELAKEEEKLRNEQLQKERSGKIESSINEIRNQIAFEELTVEEQEIVEAILDNIKRELLKDEYLKLENYTSIIENIESIAKGESVIVTHTDAYYSEPDDYLITPSDIVEGNATFETSGREVNIGQRTTSVRATGASVFSLKGRKEKLKDGRIYLGSYWEHEGYSIDIMLDEEGRPYIERNIYENWANSQKYKGILDLKLPVPRFEIKTGEEGSFKGYNKAVREEKNKRRRFYREVMETAKEQFGLSEQQANHFLQFAGSVSALKLATEFEQNGVSMNQALAMLRKISHEGIGKVLAEVGMNYPSGNFDTIQDAARTLAYILHQKEQEKVVHTPSEIAEGIEPRADGVQGALEETITEQGIQVPNKGTKPTEGHTGHGDN